MYYPKNKIKTGLYTNGEEYIYADDKSSFTGYYYALYNGKFYEGKSPTKGNRELILGKSPKVEIPNNIESFFPPQSALEYDNLSDALIIPTSQKQNVPVSTYRSPSQSDYAIGQFIRYFCRKVNEPIFTEINKSTYTNLFNKNQNWVQLYIPFQVYWLVAGDYQKVVQTNKTNVLKIEQNLQVYGFTKYIEKFGGYDKFYF